MKGLRTSVGAALALAVVSSLVLAPVQRADAAEPVDPSGITFNAFRSGMLPIVPGQPFWLQIDQRVPSGPMHFVEVIDGSDVFIGTPTWQNGGSVGGTTISLGMWEIQDPTRGTHSYAAVYEATDQFDALRVTLDVVVEPLVMTMWIDGSNPVQANHEVVLVPNFENAGTGTPFTGQFEWRNADSGALVATRPGDDYVLTFSSLPVGTHRFTVTYTGDPARTPATSPVFELTVIPDQADAKDVGVLYSTFYPATDGYRDTLTIRGFRYESASVAIQVFGPTGALVRSASVPAATGYYSSAWNGRTSAGAILPAGLYRVVQTLSDGGGGKSTYTSTVSLSTKQLVTKTAYVTLAGPKFTVKGNGGGGSVTTSTAGGYAKLTAGNGWAGAGWEFVLPSAFAYKSVSVEVSAKGGFSAPPNSLGIQNFASCPRSSDWNESCFERWVTVGNSGSTKRWYATSASSSEAYRSGPFVRSIVIVNFGTVYVYSARAKVVYQVWTTPTGRVSVPR